MESSNYFTRLLAALGTTLVLASASCSNDIDRQFGPSSLHGSGPLPGVVFTTSEQTGV